MDQPSPNLPFYERLAASLIISFLVFLVLFNLWADDPELPGTGTPYTPKPPLIEVVIQGAVQHPGTYQVKKGTTVQEALELARPLENANPGRIKLDSKILRRRVINLKATVVPGEKHS
jgi:hypothetical protein